MSTKIEWTKAPGRKGETWNPIAAFDIETGKRGWFCTKVSEGCQHCYAEGRNVHIGNGHRYAANNLNKIRFELVGEEKPFHWRAPRMVFVCSMTDLFHPSIPDWMIAQVFAVMACTPMHIYQVLTKRPERMAELLSSDEFREEVAVFVREIVDERVDPNDRRTDDLRATAPEVDGDDWPLPNVWGGTSAEHQKAADERIPHLLLARLAVRFISAEPLLGPLDLSVWLEEEGYLDDQYVPPLDWVIVGGESGLQARETLLSSIESIVAQCDLEGVVCFVKQLGRHPFDDLADGSNAPLKLTSPKGNDIENWPERLRVRAFPGVAAAKP